MNQGSSDGEGCFPCWMLVLLLKKLCYFTQGKEHLRAFPQQKLRLCQIQQVQPWEGAHGLSQGVIPQ